MTRAADRPPTAPPPWIVHAAWRSHRMLPRVSGGRFLWTTSSKRGWGALRLTTTGRTSGLERSVIVGYVKDGPDLVTLAMNGWGGGLPSWWLNLDKPVMRVGPRRGPDRGHWPTQVDTATGVQRAPHVTDHGDVQGRRSQFLDRVVGGALGEQLAAARTLMPGGGGQPDLPHAAKGGARGRGF